MTRKLCLFAYLLLIIYSCNKPEQNNPAYPHYDIVVKIDPERAYIEVEGILTVPKISIPGEDPIFFLDSSLHVENFVLNGREKYSKDTIMPGLLYMPAAARYYSGVPLKLQQNPNEFTFSYKGKLSQLPEFYANTVSPEWVEMGLYYPWFPYSESIKLYTYKIEADMEGDYTVFGIGETHKNKNGVTLESNSPTNDIVICATKDVKSESWQAGTCRMNLYHDHLNDSVVQKMKGDMSVIMKQLSSYFGGGERTLNVILSKREKGGGYGRIGGMFLGGFDPEQFYEHSEGYYRYFAHEFSHLWWYRADTKSWEDWLNEGFAEYTALMVVRDVFGEASFKKRIESKMEAIAGTPPIWGFDRSDISTDVAARNAELLLYSKAPAYLHQLEERMGKADFLALCNTMFSEEVENTEAFLELLRAAGGEETAEWFVELLRTG